MDFRDWTGNMQYDPQLVTATTQGCVEAWCQYQEAHRNVLDQLDEMGVCSCPNCAAIPNWSLEGFIENWMNLYVLGNDPVFRQTVMTAVIQHLAGRHKGK